MSEWVACPVCAAEVYDSYRGWSDHIRGPRHQLVTMGLSPDDAERVALALIDAGASFDAAMALIRQSLSMPPVELARRAEALRAFVDDKLGEAMG